jgi:hypothetical protein
LKTLFIFFALSLFVSNLRAQNAYGCGIPQFKKLTSISKKDSINDSDLVIAVQLVKKLEEERCTDYTGRKNGEEYVITTRTGLFGKICLKKNDEKAVSQYIDYLNRQRGSAEEELSYVFERLFQRQAKSVLLKVDGDKYLLDHLVWGFLNNHYYNSKDIDKVRGGSNTIPPQLNVNNYKKIFFGLSPQVKGIYPEYKKSIDYLLSQIYAELKKTKLNSCNSLILKIPVQTIFILFKSYFRGCLPFSRVRLNLNYA